MKLGRIVDTVNTGNGSSVVGGAEDSGRAVEGEREPGVVGERSMRGVLGWPHDGDSGGIQSGGVGEVAERRRADPGGDGGARSRRRCDGERERDRRPEGGASRVADLTGIWSRGKFALRRSADVVSSLHSGGMLGRCGGGGRENPS